jgi:GT2 family glycosyltransferase
MNDKAVVSAVDLMAERKDDPVGTVAMPIRDSINAQTMMSLMQTDWPGQVDKLWARGNLLALQRNHLVGRMRGEWILFIDDDMTWEPDAVKRLVETKDTLEEQGLEPDVVGALCFSRSIPHQPTLYFKWPEQGSYNFMEDWDDDVVEVDATGMAFALIRKAAFERLSGSEMPPYEERRRLVRSPDFFRWYGGLGEDLRFCEDVRSVGGRVFVDTRIEIGHVSEKTVTRKDFVREIAERSDLDQVNRERINGDMGLPTMTRRKAKQMLYG